MSICDRLPEKYDICDDRFVVYKLTRNICKKFSRCETCVPFRFQFDESWRSIDKNDNKSALIWSRDDHLAISNLMSFRKSMTHRYPICIKIPVFFKLKNLTVCLHTNENHCIKFLLWCVTTCKWVKYCLDFQKKS